MKIFEEFKDKSINNDGKLVHIGTGRRLQFDDVTSGRRLPLYEDADAAGAGRQSAGDAQVGDLRPPERIAARTKSGRKRPALRLQPALDRHVDPRFRPAGHQPRTQSSVLRFSASAKTQKLLPARPPRYFKVKVLK